MKVCIHHPPRIHVVFIMNGSTSLFFFAGEAGENLGLDSSLFWEWRENLCDIKRTQGV
jgi:hypothetical protein